MISITDNAQFSFSGVGEREREKSRLGIAVCLDDNYREM